MASVIVALGFTAPAHLEAGRMAQGTVLQPHAATTTRRLAHAVPQHWHAPTWWLPQALCIHAHEGAWTANTGNGYFGGFQFLASTYRSVGGRADGRADLDSPREQVYRAWLTYRRDGNSWREWGTATRCGLR